MKIQYLVNWTYQCRMSSFTRALSLPSSSASLSCVVGLATYSAEAPPRMHQNSPFSDKNQKIFWGGGTGPSPDPSLSGEGDTPASTRRLDSARTYDAQTPPTLKPWSCHWPGDGDHLRVVNRVRVCNIIVSLLHYVIYNYIKSPAEVFKCHRIVAFIPYTWVWSESCIKIIWCIMFCTLCNAGNWA